MSKHLQARAEKVKQLHALLAAENPTAEQVDQAKALKVEVDQLQAAHDRESVWGQLREGNASDVAGLAQPLPTKAGQGAQSPLVAREAWLKDPMRGFQSSRHFLSEVVATYQRRPSAHMRDYLKATVGSDEHSIFDETTGGILVVPALSPQVRTTPQEQDVIGPRITLLPLPQGVFSIRLPFVVDKDHSTSVTGGLQVYRREEAGSVNASRMRLARHQIDANPLMGVSYGTEELISAAQQVFVSLVEQGFRREFTNRDMKERFRGTGVGERRGFLNSPCLLTVDAEDAQDPNTIVYENIINMFARFWGMNGVWVANKTCAPQLMLLTQVVGTTGVPVFQPSAREGVPGTLLGMPLVWTEYASALGTVGDISLVDWSQYFEAMGADIEGFESTHVRWLNHERALKFVKYVGGGPSWEVPLTPFQGDTLSAFVTLADRAA